MLDSTFSEMLNERPTGHKVMKEKEMPFKSDKQRAFMFSQHPEIAKEFQKATPPGIQLPKKVGPMMNKQSSYEGLLKKGAK